ncbi:hypothetical protein ASZ90_017446 [hydrocarbon metagenome]|uniref:Zinc-ribbon domain-containing protein n=1 Tax=hydrocarbon metagenome TaxID=938273 RepID=A0A0W8E925_9ZZZZ
MYCSNCGENLPDSVKFCTECGSSLQPVSHNIQPQTTSLIGFSPRINDPAFKKYQNASKNWALMFSLIIAVIAIIAFPIYGEVSGEMEMPYSLYYGMGIGGMFVAIALFQNIGKGLDSTWDGVVVDKRTYKKTESDRNSNTFSTHTYFEYTVKRDNGKIYTHSTKGDDTVYNYYNIGDKVRHHKGFGYEKYDKSRDTFLFCTACASINDISDEVCFRCKCPLLK